MDRLNETRLARPCQCHIRHAILAEIESVACTCHLSVPNPSGFDPNLVRSPGVPQTSHSAPCQHPTISYPSPSQYSFALTTTVMFRTALRPSVRAICHSFFFCHRLIAM